MKNNTNDSSQPTHSTQWYLEGFVDEGTTRCRIPISSRIVRVGRSTATDFPLRFDNISRLHAELWVEGGTLWVRDLESRNGTFVNRCRISEPTPLNDGDIVHFATREFRVSRQGQVKSSSTWDTLKVASVLPAEFPFRVGELIRLLREECVIPLYQPIVELATGKIWAYEVLGRGALAGLPSSPKDLLEIAASVGLEAELSRVFRKAGIRSGHASAPPGGFFVNIHASELSDLSGLIYSLRALRAEYPNVPLVAELHEVLVTTHDAIARLREELLNLRISLAYDDFGAGQSRLVELAEAPPDYLKFDRSLVHGVAEAGQERLEMLALLITYAHNRGVRCLAEGLEQQQDAEVCRRLGFDYAQGYLYGKPDPWPWSASTVPGTPP